MFDNLHFNSDSAYALRSSKLSKVLSASITASSAMPEQLHRQYQRHHPMNHPMIRSRKMMLALTTVCHPNAPYPYQPFSLQSRRAPRFHHAQIQSHRRQENEKGERRLELATFVCLVAYSELPIAMIKTCSCFLTAPTACVMRRHPIQCHAPPPHACVMRRHPIQCHAPPPHAHALPRPPPTPTPPRTGCVAVRP